MKRTFVALLAALALFGAACSSGGDAPPETGEAKEQEGRQGQGGKKGDKTANTGGQDGKKGGGSKKGGSGGGKGGDDALPGAPDSETVPGAAEGEDAPGLQPSGEGGAAFASKSSSYSETSPDAEKDGPLSPGYAEATQVDVQGLGEDLRITFTFAGDVPQQMPTDKTYMIVAFGMSAAKKGQDGYAINAQASNRGWQVALGAKEEAKRFPGTFFVRGNTVEFTLPWSAVGGPRPFEFYGSSSWFQYAAGVTSYSVDPIPNDKGAYPR